MDSSENTRKNPVILAAEHGAWDVVEALMDSGRFPNKDFLARSPEGETLMSILLAPKRQSVYAGSEARSAMFTRLLGMGLRADDEISTVNHAGASFTETVIARALAKNAVEEDLINKALISIGEESFRRIEAACKISEKALSNGQAKIVSTMLDFGLDPNSSYGASKTPATMLTNDPGTLRDLRVKGASFTVTDGSGREMISKWVERDANHAVVQYIVEELIKESPDGDHARKAQIIAAFVASKKKDRTSFWSLVNARRKDWIASVDANGRNFLRLALDNEDFVQAKRLVKKGVDIKTPASDGKSPISHLLGEMDGYLRKDRGHKKRKDLFEVMAARGIDWETPGANGIPLAIDLVGVSEMSNITSAHVAAGNKMVSEGRANPFQCFGTNRESAFKKLLAASRIDLCDSNYSGVRRPFLDNHEADARSCAAADLAENVKCLYSNLSSWAGHGGDHVSKNKTKCLAVIEIAKERGVDFNAFSMDSHSLRRYPEIAADLSQTQLAQSTAKAVEDAKSNGDAPAAKKSSMSI